MNSNDTEIGKRLIPGERVPLAKGNLTILLDSLSLVEVVLIGHDKEDNVELVTAGRATGYTVERDREDVSVTLDLARLNPNARYILGAYSSQGSMPNLLATLSEPRSHIAIESKGEGAVSLLQVYDHKGEWRLKADSGWFSNGLQGLLTA